MENNTVKRNIPVFSGEKYSTWKMRVRALLTELDLIQVIDEEPQQVDNEWTKADSKAKSVIINYLSDSLLNFVTATTTAKEVFQKLDNLYERKSLATQLAIRKKLLTLKLQGETKLITHFSVFDGLIGELVAAGAKIEETDKVSHLLLTLPTMYDGVITAIETLSEDSLSLAFVKTRLLDHEVKLMAENKDTSAKVLHVEKVPEKLKKTSSNRRYFRYVQNKFEQNRFKSRNNKRFFGGRCNYCGKRGHMKKNCIFLKRKMESKSEENSRTLQRVQLINSSEDTEAAGFAFMLGNVNLTTETTNKNKIKFLLDSGASDHIINREDLAGNFKKLLKPVKISVAKSGTFIFATKVGTLNVISDLGIQGELKNVLYSPEVPHNLLSVPRMIEAGMKITFAAEGVEVRKESKVVMRGKSINNLIIMDFVTDKSKGNLNSKAYSVITANYDLWHQRLGHMSKNKFLTLKNKQMVQETKLIDQIIPNDTLCEACIEGKQCRTPFNKTKDKSQIQRPLFVVHSDVCGPITPPTNNNKNYFVTFIDQYTHYCVTYLITYKSEVFSMFKDFVVKSEAHFNLKLVNIYCDNGREYLSNEMRDYCSQRGISYHFTIPRTPQLNGVAERMNRTIIEKARAMISGTQMKKEFWGDAVLTATYLINITPTKALSNDKTPYESWHHKKPQIRYLKIFGSTVYALNNANKAKFDVKSWKGILVGYEPNGYRVWNVEKEKYVIVRDVIVDETNYLKSRPGALPGKDVNVEKSRDEAPVTDVKIDNSDMKVKSVTNECKSGSNKPDESVDSSSTSCDDTCVGDQKQKQINEPSFRDTYGKRQMSSEPRRSDRITKRRFESYNENEMFDECIMSTQAIVNNLPTSYYEIKNRHDRAKWEAAMQEEIDSLLFNKTWSLVQRPQNKNIVDCKWIFAIKNDESGNPVKYKARLVAKGFSQKYLIDYNETFAPVARISSFRFMIIFANQFNLEIHHMDVKTAFLHGRLKEEIYMSVPEGIKSKKGEVCKLNRALYGLKQAARCWFEEFDKALTEIGFVNSPVDRCIYFLNKTEISKNIYVILYVDDLLLITGDIKAMNNLKNYLMTKFRMVDLKELKLFLGIRVNKQTNKITLDQSVYIKTILQKFNMQDCNPVNSPAESKLNYERLNSDEPYDAPCRSVIGCLMYLMVCTRPDLSTVVNILSRYMNKNNQELWKCLKRVLRYLQGTVDMKLTYKRKDYNDILTGYVDSDWGGSDTLDRKSTTGYLFQLFGNCTVSWATKRQSSVAASSTEAEYMALFEGVKEALWLKSLAISVNINIDQPIVIYEDNNGCISIANNPTCHKRTKHIDIKYHFTREQVEKKVIELKYVCTGEQLADVLTKPLPAARFLELRVGLGLE